MTAHATSLLPSTTHAPTLSPASESPRAAAPSAVPTNAAAPGAVEGGPRVLLRLEGLALLLAATAAYGALAPASDLGWGSYAALFFTPDLAFLAYLGGPRLGALSYNATHSTLTYLALLGLALLAAPSLAPLALVGLAHVGFDRALGYGLKYASAFGHTHLGQLGRAR